MTAVAAPARSGWRALFLVLARLAACATLLPEPHHGLLARFIVGVVVLECVLALAGAGVAVGTRLRHNVDARLADQWRRLYAARAAWMVEWIGLLAVAPVLFAAQQPLGAAFAVAGSLAQMVVVSLAVAAHRQGLDAPPI